MDNSTPELVKPRLRGVSHLLGAILSVPFGVGLYQAARPEFSFSVLIYCLSLFALLATSACYHVPYWDPEKRAFLRKLDHAMIFVLIGGSYTPFLSVLGENVHPIYHLLIFAGSIIGIFKSLFIQSKSRVLRILSYGGLGLAGLLIVPEMYLHLGVYPLTLILTGGLSYLVGTAAYALKRPNPITGYFEYHEVFHFFVLIAAALHFTAIREVTTRLL